MNDVATASTVPAPPDLPNQCPRCGTTYTHAEMAVWPWRAWPDLGLEIAECACMTTISRPMRTGEP